MALRAIAATLILLLIIVMSCLGVADLVDPCCKEAGGGFQGMFVFGSSIVDNGNNNYLDTLGKANYFPYGVDFSPLGPTGRFSNGKNLADLLAQLLRIPLLPPFLDPFAATGSTILHGVNYGSGGSGILNQTGSITGKVMNLNEQISNFEEETLPKLESMLSCTRQQMLPHYLILIAAGGNDYQFNYFLSGSGSGSGSRPGGAGAGPAGLHSFTDDLISAYSHRLKRLYKLGARKFALIGVNPIGCVPVVRAANKRCRCQKDMNSAAKLFNKRLISLVDALTVQLPGSHFVVVNAYNIINDILHNPASKGFSNVKSACCELSITGILCKGSGGVCPNRSSYVFFDAQHNTEAASAIIASKAYSSFNISQVYPINLQKLSRL
ncbi:hypothetical protein Dimus_025459 [Dionaea muscipula]